MLNNRLLCTALIFSGPHEGPVVFVEELSDPDPVKGDHIARLRAVHAEAVRKHGPGKATSFIQLNGNRAVCISI